MARLEEALKDPKTLKYSRAYCNTDEGKQKAKGKKAKQPKYTKNLNMYYNIQQSNIFLNIYFHKNLWMYHFLPNNSLHIINTIFFNNILIINNLYKIL